MEYGRLGRPEPNSVATNLPKKTKLKRLLILTALLIGAAAFAAGVAVAIRKSDDSGGGTRLRGLRPSEAISRACGATKYQSVCLSSLAEFAGADSASPEEIAHISVNATLRRFNAALIDSSGISHLNMDPHVRSAHDACLELLDDSVDLLSRSLAVVGGRSGGTAQDVLTWLSASMTNHDTCIEGFEQVTAGDVSHMLSARLNDLSEFVSNSLAIYSQLAVDGDLSGIPVRNRRRRLLGVGERSESGPFPAWLSRRDRRLLDTPPAAIQADVIVSINGNGTCRTIGEAIKMAPEKSSRRFIIYVRAGRYEEKTLKVGRKKTNLMFIGDGKGKTVITGHKSVLDNMTTFHTASFAASGNGLILKDITFENSAGAQNHQAVALRVGADHAVIYQCNIIGYQDTLYVHSQRQFYRECDIYGTVDFIFGNAAVVFQSCNIHARKPLPLQKNTITAQNRKDPNQNTGISIHNCSLVAESDLQANLIEFPTFLGRPWKLYSRTVYMSSNMGGHIDPRGWLEWNGSFALDTLYYAEYKNYGPGGAIGRRVNWPGYHVITAVEEASKFTVGQFLSGGSWLPATGIAFTGGLGD